MFGSRTASVAVGCPGTNRVPALGHFSVCRISTWAARSAHNSISLQSQEYRAPRRVAVSRGFSQLNKGIHFRSLLPYWDPPCGHWLPLKYCQVL